MKATTFETIPPRPLRPHDFFGHARKSADVRLAGRARPVRISYVEAGAGSPLVLVHGLMTSSYSFRYIISRLAERYRVLALDLPGAGQSDAPTDLAMTPENVGALLDGFWTATNLDKAFVVGNSLGGYLSLWFSVLHPERVERLVLMHSPGFPELRLYALQAVLALPGAQALLNWQTRNPELFVIRNVYYADPSIMSQEEAREYAAIFKDPARAVVFRRVLQDSMNPFAMTRLHRKLKELREGGAPFPRTLLLWSQKDVLVSPKFGPRYQKLLPHAKLEWIVDTSHFMHVDTPEVTISHLVSFGGER